MTYENCDNEEIYKSNRRNGLGMRLNWLAW
jgi:hypothetical protein